MTSESVISEARLPRRTSTVSRDIRERIRGQSSTHLQSERGLTTFGIPPQIDWLPKGGHYPPAPRNHGRGMPDSSKSNMSPLLASVMTAG